MVNTERAIRHAVQERLPITLLINKVCLSLVISHQMVLLFRSMFSFSNLNFLLKMHSTSSVTQSTLWTLSSSKSASPSHILYFPVFFLKVVYVGRLRKMLRRQFSLLFLEMLSSHLLDTTCASHSFHSPRCTLTITVRLNEHGLTVD